VKGAKMKVNCLNCGHKIDLDDVYDNYDGMVKCTTCRRLLHIKTEDGRLRGVNFAPAAPQTAANLFGQLQEAVIQNN
jgi:ribosomal protein S27E